MLNSLQTLSKEGVELLMQPQNTKDTHIDQSHILLLSLDTFDDNQWTRYSKQEKD